MSNESNSPVGKPEESSGSPENKTEKKDNVVKYESFEKLLGEKKSIQEKFQKTQERLQELESKLVEKEQDYEKQAEHWRTKYEETNKQLDETKKTYTWTMITNQIKSKAQDFGCKNPDKLLRLMDDEDLKTLSNEIGEGYKLNNDVLNQVLEKNKKDNYFLFENTTSKIANGTPKNVEPKASKTKDDILSEYIKGLK